MIDMLRYRDRIPKAKAVETSVEVYDGKNNLIRIVAIAQMDGFADEIELPDGNHVKRDEILPIIIRGVEAIWTEGDGNTVFVWDCRNEFGEMVAEGDYRIDIKQADSFGHNNLLSRNVHVRAM
jgi:hypothetical protein